MKTGEGAGNGRINTAVPATATDLFKEAGALHVVQMEPSYTVGDPINNHSDNAFGGVTNWDKDGNPVQVDNLTSAQKLLGVDVDASFDDIPSNESLFEDMDPAINKASDMVTRLRLKSVASEGGLTDNVKKRIDALNEFISFNYAKRAELAREEEERKQAEMKQKEEAEAKELVARAEALMKKIDDSSTDGDMASIQFELVAIARRLHMNVDDLLAKVEAKAATLAKSEAK